MAMTKIDPSNPDGPEMMREMVGPGAIDQQLRQAVQFCWMSLPPKKRSLDAVEKEVRRLVDRMFRDMREDEAKAPRR